MDWEVGEAQGSSCHIRSIPGALLRPGCYVGGFVLAGLASKMFNLCVRT